MYSGESLFILVYGEPMTDMCYLMPVGLQPAWNNLHASHYYVRLERRFNQLPSLSSKHHSELTTCSNNTAHCWRHRRWQTNPYPSFVWGEILPVWWNQQVSSQQLRWKEPTLICYPSILFVNALTDATMTQHCWTGIRLLSTHRNNGEIGIAAATLSIVVLDGWCFCR